MPYGRTINGLFSISYAADSFRVGSQLLRLYLVLGVTNLLINKCV